MLRYAVKRGVVSSHRLIGSKRWQSNVPKMLVQQGMRVECDLAMMIPETEEMIVDTSIENGSPVSFVVGQGSVIPGLEDRMVGMAVNDEWDEILKPEEAFGFEDPTKIVRMETDDRHSFDVGDIVHLTNNTIGRVKQVNKREKWMDIDCNHEFAGKSLRAKVKLLKILEETPSSQLESKVLSPGDGKTFPQHTDTVHVHYVAMLASDGRVFDNSKPHLPLQFKVGVGRVIKGWDILIPKMSLGEKARLFVPSEFGYGSTGAGGGIVPPDSNLVFDVELVKIENK